jgi:hypothetical protein
MPARKECHRFGSDISWKARRLTHDEYLANFEAATTELRVGEASVWYLSSEHAAAEIKEFAPSAKIIINLRNPIDMIHSLHSYGLRTLNEDIEDFRLALAAEDVRRQGLSLPPTVNFPAGLYYTKVATYSPQVRRYLDTFGAENVHIVLFEELVASPAAVYERVLGFLGVDGGFQPRFLVANSNRVPRSQIIVRLLHAPPPRVRSAIRSFVPLRARILAKSAVDRLNGRRESRPKIDPDLRRDLASGFADDVIELHALTNLDLQCWTDFAEFLDLSVADGA